MNAGGVGGGISKYNWDGELLWNYELSNDVYQHHHDIYPLENGNVLVIAWERHSEYQPDGSIYYGGVGAGWAGLKAAKTLLDSDGTISSILILEANDYIGGRSKTMNSDGSINVPFDLTNNSSSNNDNAQEKTIVGDENKCPLIALQERAEPRHRRHVEMVCGLIE